MREVRIVLVVMVSISLACGIAQAQSRARFLWGDGVAAYASFPADPTVQTSSGTVPMWSGSFSFNGTTYPYTMVGTDPAAGSGNTIVPTEIIPLKFVFSDGTTLDPTAPVCGGTSSALQLTLNSPVFQSSTFTPGGTNVGTTQYVDAYQRANFWSKVSTTSPGYHVTLSNPPQVMATQTITVPRVFGSAGTGPCAKIGQVSVSYFQLWLRQHIAGLASTSFPIFLTYNTFFTQLGQCCILGFHTAFGQAPNQLTLAVAAYNDPGIFSVPIQDIHALSHEVGEWMDDPLINNTVPGWSGGQVSGCSTLLENGDPVTGTAFQVTMNGTTYNPEDLVFLPWFEHQVPSTSVNGWYTFLNTYTSPPVVCN
jgi:hypothetical protein